MAITNASTLAEYASGISTQGATLTVDQNNKRVGIGTTNPQAMLQVGTGVTVFGNAGIASFTSLKLSGETDSTSVSTGALTVTGGVGIGLSLTVGGDVSVGGTITYEDVTNVDSLGIVTARSGLRVVGGGLTCVGVATFFNDVLAGHTSAIGDARLTVGKSAAGFTTAIALHNSDGSGTGCRINSSKSLVLGADYDNNTGADGSIIAFETDGTERLRISPSGMVGIATAAPGNPLHVYHATLNEIARFESGDATCYISFRDSASHATATSRPILGAKTDDMFFQTGGSERVRITSAGLVGIGTDAPASPLHIGQSTDDSVTAGITLKNNPSIGAQRFTLYNEEDVGTHYNSNDGGSARAHIFETGGTERLRITSTGKMGLGTNGDPVGGDFVVENTGGTAGVALSRVFSGNVASSAVNTPSLAFTMSDTATNDQVVASISPQALAGTGDAFKGHIRVFTANDAGTNTERLRITSDGYIGIGAANPTYALMIQGAGNAAAGMYLYNDTGAEGIKIVPESNGNCRIYASTNDALCLGTNDTDRITIDADGGNTTFTGTITIPTWLVHSGDSNTYFGFEGPDTITATTAGTERLRIDSSGDIGIGNDSPTAWGTGVPTIEIKGTSGSYVDRSGAIMFESQSGSHGYGGIWGDHGNLNFYSGATNRASASYRAMLSREGAVIVGGASTQASDAVTLMPDGEVTAAGFYFSNNIGAAMNNTGIRRATTNTMVFDTDSKERVRVNADGYVGIGTNSYGTIDPGTTLELGKYTPTTAVTTHGTLKSACQLILHSSNNVNQSKSGIMFTGALHPTDGCSAGIVATHENVAENSEATSLAFYTSTSETLARRVTIHTDGAFGVGTTNKSTYNDTGASSAGLSYNGGSKYTSVARVDGTPFFINRMSGDGNLVAFYESGSTVGSISVSGNTVSYNPFLGCHKGRLSDGSKPTILEGTIVETISQSIEWKTATISNVGSASSTVVIPYYGSKTSGTDTVSYGGASYTGTVGFSSNYQLTGDNKHVCVKVSDTASSKAVGGVFVGWDNSVNDAKDNGLDEPYNDLRVGGVGNYFIRIKSGETVAIGDLVESNGDGTGKVQSDDIIRSKTVGKITSTNVIKTYSDGSFLVTAVLYAG